MTPVRKQYSKWAQPGRWFVFLSGLMAASVVFTACRKEEAMSFHVSPEIAERMTAKPVLTMIRSVVSAEENLGMVKVSLGIGDERVTLEFLDLAGMDVIICSDRIEIAPGKLSFSGEEVSMEEFVRRNEVYAEAARLTGSLAGFHFSVDERISFERFFEVVSAMSQAGVSRIYVENYEEQAPVKRVKKLSDSERSRRLQRMKDPPVYQINPSP